MLMAPTVVLEIRNLQELQILMRMIVIGIIAPPEVVAPVITLIGNPTINVVVGGAFTDQVTA
jgi:hypothetical protein